jgi:23S rRNA pseudouridine1911/1915/1917 synthase
MRDNFHHTVPDGIKDVRFLDYILKQINLFSTRNGAKNAIKSGSLLLDGSQVETGRFLLPGQVITYSEAEKPLQKIFELPFQVIFEDDYLAVINKPAGFGVSGNYFRTIENALPFNLKSSGAADALQKPQAVHRLDNQTSGLLLVAKTHQVRIDLGQQFEEKRISKRYQAIVMGEVLEYGTIDTPIDGKEAITHFKRLQIINSIKHGSLSLIELTPLTGRTHQLRIHLSEIGHPILGDSLYTTQHALLKHKGLYLCATYLEFEHPVSKETKTVSIEIPHKFTALMKRTSEQYQRLAQSFKCNK